MMLENLKECVVFSSTLYQVVCDPTILSEIRSLQQKTQLTETYYRE